jgi:lysophospholipase L1-like esterase
MNTPRLVSLRQLAMLGALACTVSFVRAQNALANTTVAPAAPTAVSPMPAAAPPAQATGRGRPQAGPPAPVPPEVAFARPTAAELVQANDALQKFLTSDTSIKPLADKYPGLIVVQPPRPNTAIMPYPRSNRHAGFVELAKQGNIDLLLDGDSITDWWTRNGKDAFAKYFGSIKTANFAVAGERTEQILWGLQNGEGQGFQPKAIMLMIGTNNMGINTAPEIAEGVGAIVLEMRKDFPNAKILLLAIFPRGDPGDPVRAKIAEVNQIIAKLDDQQHVFYLDIGSKFLDENGVFLPGAFLSDKLHPQEKGYEIWGEAVQEPLANMMK